MLKPYLEAGKITGTQGLRGEIRVDPWCDSAEALCRLKRLYFEEGKQELKVVSARTQKRMAILKLEGVDSIEQAYLLPAIPMTVIEIRLEEGLMRIRPIEGIFDHED